jgi:hypothetical protein
MEDTIATTLSEAITWIATETMTAIEGIPTDQVDMPLEPPVGGDEMGPDSSEGSYFLARLFPSNTFFNTKWTDRQNTLIGFLIIIISSMVNALGLNVTKLDHLRQQSIPRRERKKDYMRVLWLAGMGMYM